MAFARITIHNSGKMRLKKTTAGGDESRGTPNRPSVCFLLAAEGKELMICHAFFRSSMPPRARPNKKERALAFVNF